MKTSTAKESISGIRKRTRSVWREISDGLEAIRAHVRELQDQRRHTEHLPTSLEKAHARVDAFIAGEQAFAADRAPAPEVFSRSPSDYRRPKYEMMHLLVAYLAPALGEAMKAAVSVSYVEAEGISEDERSERLAKLDRDLLDAELAEEAVIRAAEDAGFSVHRRKDADPRAVLAHVEELP